MACWFVSESLRSASAAVADEAGPPGTDLVKRGHDVALAGDCMPCHTSAPKQESRAGRLSTCCSGSIASPNITPYDAIGIGKWTFDDFKRASTTASAPTAPTFIPPRRDPAFTKIEDDDLKALWAFLRSLKPIDKPQKANGPGFPFKSATPCSSGVSSSSTRATFKPDKTKSATWSRGAYLVEALAHCNAGPTPRATSWARRSLPSASRCPQIDTWYAPDITEKALKEVNKWDKAKPGRLPEEGGCPQLDHARPHERGRA